MVREIGPFSTSASEPCLASDGGWLEIVGFESKTLKIRYEGACASCRVR
ncbi:MAG: NifU family protein [Acidobacteria bacterium]|nr:NifU family protein [Acidobacteriota bacterium]